MSVLMNTKSRSRVRLLAFTLVVVFMLGCLVLVVVPLLIHYVRKPNIDLFAIYPNAQQINIESLANLPDLHAPGKVITFWTPDRPGAVMDFYIRTLPTQGWWKSYEGPTPNPNIEHWEWNNRLLPQLSGGG